MAVKSAHLRLRACGPLLCWRRWRGRALAQQFNSLLLRATITCGTIYLLQRAVWITMHQCCLTDFIPEIQPHSGLSNLSMLHKLSSKIWSQNPHLDILIFSPFLLNPNCYNLNKKQKT
ncbi:unnamed protein product [Pleuronectes platessa]|uniref:Uncharacterized protein n=1 Tax=Pleuronectes platessa TaxID=8262 RepID=A0A9N7UZ96_PLEPL|nr:unnamed protein product [Pleuronectes platessa]